MQTSNLWGDEGYNKDIPKKDPIQTKANINNMTNISNLGNGFGSSQINAINTNPPENPYK